MKSSSMENKESTVKVDIGTFVHSVERFTESFSGLLYVLSIAKKLYRWDSPVFSFMYVLCISCVLLLSPGVIPVCTLYSLIGLMLFHLAVPSQPASVPCMKLNYVALAVRKDEAVRKPSSSLRAIISQEHLHRYLDIVVSIQILCCELVAQAEFLSRTIRFQTRASWSLLGGFILLLIGCLMLRPVTCIVVLHAATFLANRYFLITVRRLFSALLYRAHSLARVSKDFSQDDSTELSKGSGDTEKLSDEINVDVKLPCASEQPVGFQGLESSSEVSRLANYYSLSHRRFGPGLCYTCGSQFTSIMNKRRYCSNCGYSFCAKCCSARIPRALFGATAPAAYEEKVVVCNGCFSFLINQAQSFRTELVS